MLIHWSVCGDWGLNKELYHQRCMFEYNTCSSYPNYFFDSWQEYGKKFCLTNLSTDMMLHFIKALLQFNNEIILQTLELWAKWNCLSCGLTYLVMIMKINSKSIYRYFKTQLLNVFFMEYVCVHSYWMFSLFSICIFISIKMTIVYLSIFFYCSPFYF